MLKVMNFFKNSHFALFGLFGIYAKDSKFINGTHTTYTYRYTQTHAHIQIPFSHFTFFGSFGIHAKDTNFTFGTTHTHTDTHRLMHTYRYRYHFYILHFLVHLAYMLKIFGTPQNCTCTDTQTCTHIDTHMYRDINTDTLRHMHVCINTQTHTYTHADVYVGNLRKLLLEVHFLKSKLAKIVLVYDIYWNNLETSSLTVELRAWIQVTQYCWHN